MLGASRAERWGSVQVEAGAIEGANRLRGFSTLLLVASLTTAAVELGVMRGGGSKAGAAERTEAAATRGARSPAPAKAEPPGESNYYDMPNDVRPGRSAGAWSAGSSSGKLALHLSAPMRALWRLGDAAVAPRDLRLDVRLGPRGVPKHRLPRGTLLQAERGTTWIEFIGGPLDDVLRLRIDCRTEPERGVEVVVTPFVQPGATGGSIRYTEYAERRLDQLADVAAQRAEVQLRLLGAVPGKDSKSAPRGAGALTPAGIRAKMMADYQYQAARETQKRLAHLDRLREELDGKAELEVRALRADDGAVVRLVEAASTSALAENLSQSYGGRSTGKEANSSGAGEKRGRARP